MGLLAGKKILVTGLLSNRSIAFGIAGGGHTAASGAEITGSLPEVQDQLLEATRKLLNSN